MTNISPFACRFALWQPHLLNNNNSASEHNLPPVLMKARGVELRAVPFGLERATWAANSDLNSLFDFWVRCV